MRSRFRRSGAPSWRFLTAPKSASSISSGTGADQSTFTNAVLRFALCA